MHAFLLMYTAKCQADLGKISKNLSLGEVGICFISSVNLTLHITTISQHHHDTKSIFMNKAIKHFHNVSINTLLHS